MQLVWAVILDQYITTAISNLFYDDFWFKSFISTKDSLAVLCNHPEIIFVQLGLKNYMLHPHSSELFYSLISMDMVESYLTPVVLFPQFVLSVYLIGLAFIFLFGFFVEARQEENLLDHDFLIHSILIEAEEEIGSFDDMIIAGILFFFVFGWYFYFNAFFLLT